MPRSFNLNRNHFELFGLDARFGLDLDALNRAYRGIQSEVHPDRFAHLTDAEQRAAMQWATHVNAAYQTLRSPQARASYLLELAGAALDAQRGRALPAALLAEQMEWRERLEAARERRGSDELSALERETEAALQQCHAELERALDREHDLEASRLAVFRLMYLDKLRTEIGDALETVTGAA